MGNAGAQPGPPPAPHVDLDEAGRLALDTAIPAGPVDGVVGEWQLLDVGPPRGAAFFCPPGADKSVPLLVFAHGAGGAWTGAQALLGEQALLRGFAVLACESRR